MNSQCARLHLERALPTKEFFHTQDSTRHLIKRVTVSFNTPHLFVFAYKFLPPNKCNFLFY
uniref:Putative ovule protein n=1 Tax=Solanum chacoense TaxID=4108 RepID=A0A0V0HMM1_SOLCH